MRSNLNHTRIGIFVLTALIVFSGSAAARVTGLPDFTTLVEKAGPAVVNIRVTTFGERAQRVDPRDGQRGEQRNRKTQRVVARVPYRFGEALVPPVGVSFGVNDFCLRVLVSQNIPEPSRRPIHRRNVAVEESMPIHVFASPSGAPDLDVMRVAFDHLVHVIAPASQQPLQPELEAMGSGAADA